MNIESKLKDMIEFIGDDPNREGLKETPKRIVNSWKELFSGYQKNPEDIFKVFEEGACDEMVILKNIDFFSTCEHHWICFSGQISVGYIPDGKVIGVSKLARLVEIYSRRLQIQERMTSQIADTLMEYLQPKGVMVMCKAKHFCMMARGVKKQNTEMITSAVRGSFKNQKETREEFLNLIK